MNEEEILDIKRENYKLRKENFELIQDNVKLQEDIDKLRYKLEEKICLDSSTQFQEIKSDLKYVLEQTKGAFIDNWCIDWNFTDIREKYKFEE
jgi:regulator of replication initiation timing